MKNKMKEYYSNITIKFGGNNLEANSKEEYIELIKEQFYEDYGIDLVDDEIEIINERK
tara:strand:+ start:872 stop:1045 length:174 start_codon:yes stop_codon:yes gene_type:complete